MKKLFSLCLCLLLVMSLGCAFAETESSNIELTEKLNITIDIPVGYVIEKDRMDTALYASITTEEEGKAQFTLSIAYGDIFYGDTTEPFTDEDVELASEMIAADFYRPTFSLRTTEAGTTTFLIIDENDADSDYAFLIANYQGYFVQMYVEAAVGASVTAADIDAAMAMLSSAELVTD